MINIFRSQLDGMPEAASSKEDGVPEVELDWRKCIPKGVGHLCCVNDEAVWVLSSCKVGEHINFNF